MTYEEEIQAQCCSVCDLTPSCENCVKFGKKQFTEGERIGYEKGINEGLTINNVDEAYEKGLTAGGKIGRIDGEAQGRAEVVAEIEKLKIDCEKQALELQSKYKKDPREQQEYNNLMCCITFANKLFDGICGNNSRLSVGKGE